MLTAKQTKYDFYFCLPRKLKIKKKKAEHKSSMINSV